MPESGSPARGFPLDVADLGRLFELSLDPLAIASPVDGYFMRVNPAVSRALGFSERELLEIPIATLVHPEDLPESIRGLAKLARGESLAQFEHRLRCKDGRYRWIGWNTASSPAEGLVYCAGRDVTERRDAEALEDRQIPFVFATGYDSLALPALCTRSLLPEACRRATARAAAVRMIADARPMPRNLRLCSAV